MAFHPLARTAVAAAAAITLWAAAGPVSAAPRAGAVAAGNVEHGRYLAEQVAMCVECHSPRDREGRIIEDQKFMGAPLPVKPQGAAGSWAVRAPRNRGLLGYDDALALRLLTKGAIGRDGTQLKLPMPRFRMSEQDALDVIAYLRSLK